MLKYVKIENFRSLSSLSVALRPLTVLVGWNDSGKSSFLAALQRLSGVSTTSGSFHDFDRWRFDPSSQVIIEGRSGNEAAGIWPDRFARISSIMPCGFFQLPVQGVAMISNGYTDDQGPLDLGGDGSGVPSLLDYLVRRDRKRFFSIVETVKELVPGLEDLQIGTPEPARRRLDLVIENGLRIPADQASAGVRLLLFFVSLSFHPTPPKLILLEEPETGVHPRRLADVMNLLRGMTQGKFGSHAAQVVMTTHSPYLLDLVNLETDQVLVFHRKDDGSRTAEPADAERLKTFLDEFMLGEVWYNQGEAGLVAHRS